MPSTYSSPQGSCTSCTHSIGTTGAPSAVASWSASGRPVAYQLVYDTGYPNYANVLTVRADKKPALAACLQRLVPLIEQAQAEFMATVPDASASVSADG